jgi:hypothetical protein
MERSNKSRTFMFSRSRQIKCCNATREATGRATFAPQNIDFSDFSISGLTQIYGSD